MHHEAGHVLSKDVTKRFWFAAGASACFVLALNECIARCFFANGEHQNILKDCSLKILNGIMNGAIALELYFAASRMFEYQADDSIRDKEAMSGAISFLMSHYKQFEERYENMPFRRWIREHMFTHPSLGSRINRLKSRLKEAVA